MTHTADNPPLPVLTIALWLSATAVVVAGAAAAITQLAGLSGAQIEAALLAVALVWLVSIAGIVALQPFAHRTAALAMAQLGAAGLRMLACLLIGAAAVQALDAPARVMFTTIAAAYVPLLLVESACVTRHLARLTCTGEARA